MRHQIASTDFQKPLRVFVVDDRDTLKCLRMCLEVLGRTVLSASCLEQALATIPQAGCDLLL